MPEWWQILLMAVGYLLIGIVAGAFFHGESDDGLRMLVVAAWPVALVFGIILGIFLGIPFLLSEGSKMLGEKASAMWREWRAR